MSTNPNAKELRTKYDKMIKGVEELLQASIQGEHAMVLPKPPHFEKVLATMNGVAKVWDELP
jgi:hypothetical protein